MAALPSRLRAAAPWLLLGIVTSAAGLGCLARAVPAQGRHCPLPSAAAGPAFQCRGAP
jgi:hypothetical protein